MIWFRLESTASLPFEKNYYIKAENGEVICWFVQRETAALLDAKGLPDYLALDEDALLFLR